MALNAQQVSTIQGYSQQWGTKMVFIGELVGPLSYVAGGQTVKASQLGWGGFDELDAGSGCSYTGTFYCRTQYLPKQISPSTLTPGGNPTVKVQWFVTATNAEVAPAVNLSSEIVRIRAIGV